MKHSHSLFNIFLCVMVLAMLASCVHPPASVSVQMNAANFLNPNMKGHASPLALTIYQLNSDKRFNQLSYHQLIDNKSEALGSTLVDQHQLVLKPNQHQVIKLSITDETNTIAVVAHYRVIKNSNWRHIVKLSKNKQQHQLELALNSYDFRLQVAS